MTLDAERADVSYLGNEALIRFEKGEAAAARGHKFGGMEFTAKSRSILRVSSLSLLSGRRRRRPTLKKKKKQTEKKTLRLIEARS